MTRNEIIEAINATIIPNDERGITADSLNNILTEIVNAMSEGSEGSGGSGYYIDFTLADPTNPDSMELTPAAMEHNAQLYTTLMSVYNTGNMAAVGPVSTIFPDMGFITSNAVIVAGEELVAVFGVPMEMKNIVVVGADAVTGNQTTGVLGSFSMLGILIMADGSIQVSIP